MNTKTAVKRAVRKPLFQRGPQSITGDKDPDYVYRFVNDSGSRIDQMKSAGYEIVTDDDLIVGDSRVSDSSQVGSGKRVISKDGTVQYLMRQKKEFYDEDQAAKQAHNDEIEQAMKKQAQEGMYGSIKTSRD